jgi:thioesterase domain-containing protein/acyl carrier protein
LPGCTLQHRFSATESSVVSRLVVSPETEIEAAVLPVGRPVADKRVRIVDAAGGEVPPGEIGEIEVSSEYLADGYWRRPALTRERFRAAPDGRGRIVRTGDLGCWLPDGTLQHCGRADRQVKVRGYRVEPAEIESALLEHSEVREAAVVASTDERGEARLTAWIVCETPDGVDVGELRTWLGNRLASYLVPARMELVRELPTTRTGKLDRKALAEWKPGAAFVSLSRSAPDVRDGLEYQLRLLWQDVMDRRGIRSDDDFFALGGESLQAADLMVRVERLFGVSLSLADFIAEPTLDAMARQLRGKRPTASYRYLVPMRIGGNAPPFFCVHPMSGSAMHFVNLAHHFDGDRPFYALQARGMDGCGEPHASVEEMAADYLEEVRRKQPNGPYHLGGRCLGAEVAVEMARALLAAGEEVSIVAVFDTEGRPKPKKVSARKRVKRAIKRLRRAGRAGPRVQEEAYAAKLRRAGKRYRPAPFPGTLTLFTTEAARAQSEENWGALTEGRLEIESIPGEHYTVLREPHVGTLARRLEARLAAASRARNHQLGAT